MKKFTVCLMVLALILCFAGCTMVMPEAEKPADGQLPVEEPADTGSFVPEEGLTGTVSEVQPGDEVEEEPQLGGIAGPADTFWYESDSGSGTYTDSVGNEMTYSYSVPAFNVGSPDASEMNAEIEELCGPVVQEMLDAEANGYSLMYTSVAYEAYQNGDIVSVLLVFHTDIEVVEYHVFNLNVATGERASGAEMVRFAGMEENQFVEAAQAATEGKFMELYAELQSMEDMAEIFAEQLAKTMSADMFSLSSPMYLNGEGNICIIARIYALAGASYYDYVLELN